MSDPEPQTVFMDNGANGICVETLAFDRVAISTMHTRDQVSGGALVVYAEPFEQAVAEWLRLRGWDVEEPSP